MSSISVYADLRWPTKTGIGLVQREMVARTPEFLTIHELAIRGRIGSPQSPLNISSAISRSTISQGIFWSPGFMPPAWSSLPAVVTVHDLTHLHYYSKLHYLYYKTVMKPLYRKCASVICVSEFTRNEFLTFSSMAANKVLTIYNGVSERFQVTGIAYHPGFPYVLYVGNRRGYKNLHRLLKAYAISRLPQEGIRLLLTGTPDPDLHKLARNVGIEHSVRFCGNVSYQELTEIYRGARMLAFVSLYEGFGLPILEAMATGIPVLTSNVSAMPEIAGDAAITIDPRSVEQIAANLETLNYDETTRINLVRRGFVNLQRFGWDAAAAATWNLVRHSEK